MALIPSLALSPNFSPPPSRAPDTLLLLLDVGLEPFLFEVDLLFALCGCVAVGLNSGVVPTSVESMVLPITADATRLIPRTGDFLGRLSLTPPPPPFGLPDKVSPSRLLSIMKPLLEPITAELTLRIPLLGTGRAPITGLVVVVLLLFTAVSINPRASPILALGLLLDTKLLLPSLSLLLLFVVVLLSMLLVTELIPKNRLLFELISRL
mmetsp:Transcript_34275/g.40311  ORF Transcript_34275/g.40311 Transcript_34275/m.40311 type:complete len:209 (-) Transcript_34275:3358-3984(-)